MSFICDTCGEIFKNEHWEGGYIDHINMISNIRVHVARFHKEGFDKYEVFRGIIGFDGNLCEIKNIEKSSSLKKLKCAISYLEKNNHDDVVEYLNKCSIDEAYDTVNDLVIETYKKEIKQLKESIIFRKRFYSKLRDK